MKAKAKAKAIELEESSRQLVKRHPTLCCGSNTINAPQKRKYTRREKGKQVWRIKSVAWADEVGGALSRGGSVQGGASPHECRGVNSPDAGGISTERKDGRPVGFSPKNDLEQKAKGVDVQAPRECLRRSYKEVLLQLGPKQISRNPSALSGGTSLAAKSRSW